MAVLIDTSCFIGLERRGQFLSYFESLAPSEPLAMAAITVSELLVGAHRADSAGRRRRREAFIETLIEQVPVFPFDVPAAKAHAKIWASLAEDGILIGAHDLLIAATAIARDYAVLTDNVREFERVPDLEVRQPNW